jgi:hypothetical protein
MEAVRLIVEERTKNRDYAHRLMDYNNDSTTTLDDVHSLFADALVKVGAGPAEQLPPPAVCPPPSGPEVHDYDVRVATQAADLLRSPDTWNKKDGQVCAPHQKTFGIFCALIKAQLEVKGENDETDVVMREARMLVDSLATKKYSARLVDYNNDPDVKFSDLQTFFRVLRERLMKRVVK